jgi:hypothetical protein
MMAANFQIVRALYAAAVDDPNLTQQFRQLRRDYAEEFATDPTSATLTVTQGAGNGVSFQGAIAMTRGQHMALLNEVLAWLDRGIAPTSRVRSQF